MSTNDIMQLMAKRHIKKRDDFQKSKEDKKNINEDVPEEKEETDSLNEGVQEPDEMDLDTELIEAVTALDISFSDLFDSVLDKSELFTEDTDDETITEARSVVTSWVNRFNKRRGKRGTKKTSSTPNVTLDLASYDDNETRGKALVETLMTIFGKTEKLEKVLSVIDMFIEGDLSQDELKAYLERRLGDEGVHVEDIEGITEYVQGWQVLSETDDDEKDEFYSSKYAEENEPPDDKPPSKKQKKKDDEEEDDYEESSSDEDGDLTEKEDEEEDDEEEDDEETDSEEE